MALAMSSETECRGAAIVVIVDLLVVRWGLLALLPVVLLLLEQPVSETAATDSAMTVRRERFMDMDMAKGSLGGRRDAVGGIPARYNHLRRERPVSIEKRGSGPERASNHANSAGPR
jgi:hypothetical protein